MRARIVLFFHLAVLEQDLAFPAIALVKNRLEPRKSILALHNILRNAVGSIQIEARITRLEEQSLIRRSQ